MSEPVELVPPEVGNEGPHLAPPFDGLAATGIDAMD
jgi:hypothetical protein